MDIELWLQHCVLCDFVAMPANALKIDCYVMSYVCSCLSMPCVCMYINVHGQPYADHQSELQLTNAGDTDVLGIYHSYAGVLFLRALGLMADIADKDPTSPCADLLRKITATFFLACPLNGSGVADTLTGTVFRCLGLEKLLTSDITRGLTTDHPALQVYICQHVASIQCCQECHSDFNIMHCVRCRNYVRGQNKLQTCGISRDFLPANHGLQ